MSGYRQPMKRGVSDLNLYGSQENCISIIEDQSTSSNKHERTRRLYRKQLSTEDTDSAYSSRSQRNGRRNGFRYANGENDERLSSSSNVSVSSIASSSSARSKKLLSKMKGRRENANKIRSNRNLGTISHMSRKMSKVQEGEDDEEGPPPPVSPINPNDQQQYPPHPHQYPYGYPPPSHPGMQPYPGMHPGMYAPPPMHPGYYMPPPPQPQPVQPQIFIQQPAGWGIGPAPESPGAAMSQQQYRDQQLINEQQQNIIRQQQQLQDQQQEQLRKHHESMLKQRDDLESVPRKSFSRRNSDEKNPPPPPLRVKRNSEYDEVSDLSFGSPPLSEDFMEKLKINKNERRFSDENGKNKLQSRRRSGTAVSESSTASKPNRITDEFTVGILGIGDVSVLEKTIGLLKKNSFSDKFNPESRSKETAKPRSGMHGSFVDKTKEDLLKKPSSQVLAKANARMESRESLELDFNDVYSSAKPPSFTVKSGLLSDNAPPKTFRRQDSSGRNFAFENPNFSH